MANEFLRHRFDVHVPTLDAAQPKMVSVFDWADVVGRLALALIFLWSGYDMFANVASTIALMQSHGLPATHLLIWPTALFEVVGGAMLVVGWNARWAALALAAFTFVSAFIFHAYWSVPADQVADAQINFMKNMAITGGLLYVLAHGCGRYAIDKS